MRPIIKSITRDNSSNLIEGQLRLISRRGSIILSRPGKGLKGKFEIQEPGGKLRGVMGRLRNKILYYWRTNSELNETSTQPTFSIGKL